MKPTAQELVAEIKYNKELESAHKQNIARLHEEIAYHEHEMRKYAGRVFELSAELCAVVKDMSEDERRAILDSVKG